MCGRYEFSDEKDIEEINKILEEINNKYNGTVSYKTGEVFPTDNAPVLSINDGKFMLSLMSWGYPKWDSKGVIINAKCETASQKKMFAKPLYEKRCVIPSTGFYEWQKKNSSKTKDKYLFTESTNKMLYMAGIYNVFRDNKGLNESFVILTCAATKYISDVHDRMPVILYKNEIKDWILDDKFMGFIFNRDTISLNRQKLNIL